MHQIIDFSKLSKPSWACEEYETSNHNSISCSKCLRNYDEEIMIKWTPLDEMPEETYQPELVGVTWNELLANNKEIMNDLEAQGEIKKALLDRGYVVNFNGGIPSIMPKELYVTRVITKSTPDVTDKFVEEF